jgi:hypothetical protein
MWLLRTLNQIITAIKEFGNVTSDIVGQIEFAARMESLVPIQIEDEVVEDDKFLALGAQRVDLSRRESLRLATFLNRDWRLNMAE